MTDVRGSVGCGEQGGKPRARNRLVRKKPGRKPASGEYDENLLTTAWILYANRLLDTPLPVHPTLHEGYTAMRWLFFHASLASIEHDYQYEFAYLQALVFIAQHYASRAQDRFLQQTYCPDPAGDGMSA